MWAVGVCHVQMLNAKMCGKLFSLEKLEPEETRRQWKYMSNMRRFPSRSSLLLVAAVISTSSDLKELYILISIFQRGRDYIKVEKQMIQLVTSVHRHSSYSEP